LSWIKFKESELNGDEDDSHNENENLSDNNLIRSEEEKLITTVTSESEYNIENLNDNLNPENGIVNTQSGDEQHIPSEDHKDNTNYHEVQSISCHIKYKKLNLSIIHVYVILRLFEMFS
jgi:hypothetical protein